MRPKHVYTNINEFIYYHDIWEEQIQLHLEDIDSLCVSVLFSFLLKFVVFCCTPLPKQTLICIGWMQKP